MSDCSNSVDRYIIVESSSQGSLSGLTLCDGSGLTVDLITGCTTDGVNIEGTIFKNGVISGGTFYGDGSNLIGISFTGNTSGDCITNIHVSNIHSCSPLRINPFDEGNVYFGSTSGVTIEVVDGRLTVNELKVREFIDFPASTKPTAFSGRTYFDVDENALSYFPITPDNDVTINIGQESVIRVHNNTGVQINNGQACHITNQPSINGVPSVILAIATGNTTTGAEYEVSGVATHNIPNGTEGFITVFGLVRDLNITGVQEGASVYLSDTTPGGFLYTTPPIDSRRTIIGHVITTGTTTGKILVEISNENSVSVLSNTRLGIVTENNSSTGLREGGVMSINGGDNTLLDISAGSGIIVDNHTDAESPTITNISWGNTTGITISNLNSDFGSFLFIDSNGDPFQLPLNTPPDGSYRRNYIYLGFIGHANKTNIINVFNTPNILPSPVSQLNDLTESIGAFSVNGNNISVIPTTLKLVKSNGTSYKSGGNFDTDPANPSILTTGLLSGSTLIYAKQDAVLGPISSDIDSTQWDNGGTLTSLVGNRYAAHRIWHEPVNNLLVFQYGQAEYNLLTEAKENFVNENFIVPSGLNEVAYLVAVLIVQNNETDLSDATLIPQGKFAGTGGGGGVSVTTLQQAYNNSSDPEITTDSSGGPVDFKAGSGLNTSNLVTFQQDDGTINAFITGEGNTTLKNLTTNTIEPSLDITYDAGTPTKRFRSLNSYSGKTTVWEVGSQTRLTTNTVETKTLDLGQDLSGNTRQITANNSIIQDDILYGGTF
jgi:hypothetical protein